MVPTGRLSWTESNVLLCIVVACLALVLRFLQTDAEPLFVSIAFSGLAFSASYALIRWLGSTFMRAGFKGRDMCKARLIEM